MYLCVTLPMLFIFMESHAELLQVVGPENPIKAVAGEDLVLPCNIKPSISAVDMTVEWYRLDVADMLVHLYKDREDRNEKQAQTYRGRTSVFKEELQKGNASLKLSALTLSDEGEYKCLVVDKSRSKDITVHVIVEVQGSKPVITMESYDNSGGINLLCGSRGWKPEPKVLWMDRNGVTLPAEDTQIYRDTELLSVKRRITVHVHDKSDANRFYCRLQQNHLMKETEVIINSPFFAAGKKIVGILVSACLAVAVGLIFISVLWYKKDQQKRTKEKEINELKNNAEQQIQAMGKEIKELKENAEGQKKTIEEQQNQKKDDGKKIKELKDEIQNLQNISEEQKMKIEEQQKQKTKDNQQIQDLKDEIKKMKNNADQQIQAMEKEIKEMKENAEGQKKTIEDQQNQKKDDGKKIKELKDEIQNLQNISDQQKQAMEKEIKELKENAGAQKKTIEEQQNQKNNDDKQIKKLKDEIKELNNNAEGQKKRIEELEKQKKEDDKQLKKLEEENQKLQKNSEEQKMKIEDQQKQKKDDDEKIKKLEEDQQKQKEEDDEKIKKLKEEIQKLQNSLEKQNRRKEGIQQSEDKSDVPPPQPTDENQLT